MVSHPETGSDSPIGSDRDRGHDRGVVSALDLRAAEDPVGTDVVPTVAGSREVGAHMVLDFNQ